MERSLGRDIWPLAGVVEGSDSAPFAGVEVDADGGEGVKPWVDAELGLTSVTVITLPLGDRFNDLGVGTSRCPNISVNITVVHCSSHSPVIPPWAFSVFY